MKPTTPPMAGSTLFVACLALAAAMSPARADTISALREQVERLAAPELEGRLTGSAGERKAAEQIAAALEGLGARPMPGWSGFLEPFEFTAGTDDAGSSLLLHEASGEASRWTGVDVVRALSFSDSGSASGGVVFAGYGITVPEGGEVSYDSFAGLDLEGKIVLVLRYSPEDAPDDLRAALARYSGPRYKALNARELGAAALIVVTGPRSANAGETVAMSFDAALSGSGIVAASIGGELGRKIFELAGKDLEQVQRELDTGNPHAGGFEMPGLTLDLEVKIKREKKTGHNVIGYLPATAAAADAPAGGSPGYVILGAHYDHLGRGRHGNSLARKDEAGEVHFGADDNASGVAAVIAAGADLAARPRHRPILLAFWSGEELGLLGSTHFIRNSVPEGRVVAYVNLDMVGRMRDNRLNVQGVSSSSVWAGLVERANVPVGFDARTQGDPYLPTDAGAFYQAGVPTVSLFTGSHEDYHRPSDLPSKLNYEDLTRVARFASRLVGRLADLAQPPDYVKVERTTAGIGDRDSLRAYTGTIPDYTTEVEGLRLSGVIGGGPADKAGLREGDVIVEFGGRAIKNIYDYTYALDAAKVDRPLSVVVIRDGKREEVTITPTRRP